MANLGAHLLYGFIAPRRLFFAADARSECMVCAVHGNGLPLVNAQVDRRRTKRMVSDLHGPDSQPPPADSPAPDLRPTF